MRREVGLGGIGGGACERIFIKGKVGTFGLALPRYATKQTHHVQQLVQEV